MYCRRANTGNHFSRRHVGLAVQVSVCASFLPLPVALVSPVEKDSSEPYPCQRRACGCRPAEQCWKKCCCFANAEKVAWARANGVTPPAYVFEAANAESDAKIAEAAKSFGTTCSHYSKAASSDKTGGCCRHRHRRARRCFVSLDQPAPGSSDDFESVAVVHQRCHSVVATSRTGGTRGCMGAKTGDVPGTHIDHPLDSNLSAVVRRIADRCAVVRVAGAESHSASSTLAWTGACGTRFIVDLV